MALTGNADGAVFLWDVESGNGISIFDDTGPPDVERPVTYVVQDEIDVQMGFDIESAIVGKLSVGTTLQSLGQRNIHGTDGEATITRMCFRSLKPNSDDAWTAVHVLYDVPQGQACWITVHEEQIERAVVPKHYTAVSSSDEGIAVRSADDKTSEIVGFLHPGEVFRSTEENKTSCRILSVESETHTAPNGGLLTAFFAMEDDWPCDGCEAEIMKGEVMHGNREEDYDLCEACFQEANAKLLPKATAVAAPMGSITARCPADATPGDFVQVSVSSGIKNRSARSIMVDVAVPATAQPGQSFETTAPFPPVPGKMLAKVTCPLGAAGAPGQVVPNLTDKGPFTCTVPDECVNEPRCAPGGGPLIQFTVMHEDGWTCDDCGLTTGAGSIMYKGREEEYDLCQTCYQQETRVFWVMLDAIGVAGGWVSRLSQHQQPQIMPREESIHCLEACVVHGITLVVAGHADGLVKLWSIRDLLRVGTLRGHSEAVLCCSSTAAADFTALGTHASVLFITGSKDRTARLWNLQRQQCIGKLVSTCNWLQNFPGFNQNVIRRLDMVMQLPVLPPSQETQRSWCSPRAKTERNPQFQAALLH